MYNNENENNELNINETEETLDTEIESVEEVGEENTEDIAEMSEISDADDEMRKAGKRRAKYKAASGVVAILIIAAIVITNLLISAVSTRVSTRIDLTAGKILDFTDETVQAMKSVNKTINIYSLIPEDLQFSSVATAEGVEMVDKVLEKYQQLSGNITYSKIDAQKNPEFLYKYAEDGVSLSYYSIIFDAGDKYKIVNIDEVVSLDSMGNIQFLSAEQKFTAAIMSITSDNAVKVGVVQGHDRAGAFEFFSEYKFVDYDYEAVEVDLMAGPVADDINMLIIASPAVDFTAEEINNLDAYFDRGGNAQLIIDYMDYEMPALEGYLAEWGVTLYNGYVEETNSANIYGSTPNYISPEINSSPITDNITAGNSRIVYPAARAMTIAPVSNVEHTDLLTASATSRIIGSSGDTIAKGPAVISTILSRYSSQGKTAQLMIAGGSGIFAEITPAGNDFFYNSIAYMTGNESSIYIRPKNISPSVIWLSNVEIWTRAGITVVLIPLLILIAGFVIWFRRRHL